MDLQAGNGGFGLKKAGVTKTVQIRFFEELNDFFKDRAKGKPRRYAFSGTPSVKDAIESMGVPHTEVDLITVNGKPVSFAYRLRGGETVCVYPVFETLDISDVEHLRKKPLRRIAFIVDANLGRLARYLRMVGFDAQLATTQPDVEIIESAKRGLRIILTRDMGILKHGAVSRGFFIRSQKPRQQLIEVLKRLNLLSALKPFTRCIACNGELKPTDKKNVISKVPSSIAKDFDAFWICGQCERLYWQGSHYDHMQVFIKSLLR